MLFGSSFYLQLLDLYGSKFVDHIMFSGFVGNKRIQIVFNKQCYIPTDMLPTITHFLVHLKAICIEAGYVAEHDGTRYNSIGFTVEQPADVARAARQALRMEADDGTDDDESDSDPFIEEDPR